jgi:hypothetical protein
MPRPHRNPPPSPKAIEVRNRQEFHCGVAGRYHIGMKKGRWLSIVSAATLAALPLVYCTAYLSLLEIRYSSIVVNESTGQIVHGGILAPRASYRLGGDVAKTFFAPAEFLDQRLRPDIWDPLKPFKDSGGFAGLKKMPPATEPDVESDLESTTPAPAELMRALRSSDSRASPRRGAGP